MFLVKLHYIVLMLFPAGVLAGYDIDDIGGRAWPSKHGWEDCKTFLHDYDCACAPKSGICASFPDGGVVASEEYSKLSRNRPPVAMHGHSYAKRLDEKGTCIIYVLNNDNKLPSFYIPAINALLNAYINDNSMSTLMDGCIKDPVLSGGYYICFGYWNNGNTRIDYSAANFRATESDWVSNYPGTLSGDNDATISTRKLLVNNPTSAYSAYLISAGNLVNSVALGEVPTAVLVVSTSPLFIWYPTIQPILTTRPNDYGYSMTRMARAIVAAFLPADLPNQLLDGIQEITVAYSSTYDLNVRLVVPALLASAPTPALVNLRGNPLLQRRMLNALVSALYYYTNPNACRVAASRNGNNGGGTQLQIDLVTNFVATVYSLNDPNQPFGNAGNTLYQLGVRSAQGCRAVAGAWFTLVARQ